MSGTSYEYSAKSVDAAIADGLRQLGLSRNEVEIEVLHEGSRGLLGIGSSNARVRITVPAKPAPPPAQPEPVAPAPAPLESPAVVEPITEAQIHSSEPVTQDSTVTQNTSVAETQTAEPVVVESTVESTVESAVASAQESPDAEDHYTGYDEDEGQAYDRDVDPDELAELASNLLLEMLEHMGFAADIEATWSETQNDGAPLTLNVIGDNLGMLIGRHGETLASIQYLIRLMVNQRIHRWTNIVVDVGGYKARRAEQLVHMAERMAEQVMQSNRAVALEPMPANERRLVHIALRNHAHVYTESIGEADRRKVQILPK
ncbi:KH domain-containing protein [bacterium]|nr:KH domain-containing protein [bacterium]